jgi:hypothetical protein
MVGVLPIGHRDVVEGERGRGAGRLTCARLELFWSRIRGGAAGAEPRSCCSLTSRGGSGRWRVPLMAPKHHVETGGGEALSTRRIHARVRAGGGTEV